MPAFAARLQSGPLAPALALAAGTAAALGFAPIGIFAFTLFGLAALIVLAQAAPRRAPLLGWAWGLGHFAFGCRWIAEAFAYQDKMPHWLGWVAVAGLAALLATMPAIACALTWAWRRRAPADARLWAFPAAWMATEWLRGHLFTGFPWNTLAASTLDMPGLPLAAATWGALGLSGLIALAAAAIAFARWRAGVVALALAGIGVALGGAFAARTRAPNTELVIVQPNIGQAEKWDPATQDRDLAKLMRLSHPDRKSVV